jgi:alpha-mannosidase
VPEIVCRFASDHQTYTTQSKLKQGNRDMETLLRDLEYFATLASLEDKLYQYPK